MTDRPGDWGPRFDRVIAEVRATGEVVMLGLDEGDDATYAAANEAILDEAGASGRRRSFGRRRGHRLGGPLARPRRSHRSLRDPARARNHPVREMLTT